MTNSTLTINDACNLIKVNASISFKKIAEIIGCPITTLNGWRAARKTFDDIRCKQSHKLLKASETLYYLYVISNKDNTLFNLYFSEGNNSEILDSILKKLDNITNSIKH